jgi:acetoin utilization deacetylase AcuC-like enzyme
MIFVSAGYDAHFSDPLTTLTLNTRGYYQLSQRLVELAETFSGGRIMFVLEGGYDPKAMKDNIQAGLAAMCDHNDYSDVYGEGPQPSEDAHDLIIRAKALHHL